MMPQTYSLGIDIVDKEHSMLFNILSELQSAIKEDMPFNEQKILTMRIVDKLTLYTITHLEHEEAMLKEIGYPGLISHCDIHSKLKTKLENIGNSCLTIEDEQEYKYKLVELFLFVSNWLYSHILSEDAKYVPYYKRAKENG